MHKITYPIAPPPSAVAFQSCRKRHRQHAGKPRAPQPRSAAPPDFVWQKIDTLTARYLARTGRLHVPRITLSG
ncbi:MULTISPECIES: hypothetical protein [Sulfitobacter]|uniref:hypothetical protein n=1 Tax=Sulfitobacter TaxID=60136 RepID=UPI000066AA0A|nr:MULTISPECIES: hypothetical protein [Sulfitobacter]EAP84679.1 hypothetical protein EE36_16757 [Sulfitobacter sp. EE-36]OAN84109.1 hypothetical protein A8B81_00320 [Sulfitobacter pontiacus]